MKAKKLIEVCEIISPGIKKFDGVKKYVATADVDCDKIINFTEITYKNRPSRANIEVKENDVLVARMAETKKFLMADKNFQDNYIFSTGFAVLRVKDGLISRYLFYFLTTKDFNLQKDKLAVGATQKAINNPALKKIKIPVPPLPIQQKIVERLDAIKKAQELNDKQIELAEELFQSLLHRELDPKGKNWEVKKLGDVLDYEQPTKYIVSSTDYKDDYPIPVLTAGKSFILGYTNEKDGVFPIENLPVIIFDDFTTDIKFVDFPFKVKSSAMKILHAKKNKADIRFLFYKMLTIKFSHNQHKRYWISEYSNLKIPLPPLETQQKIVGKLSAVQEYKNKLLDQKQKLQELFESVLNKSFKGQL